MFYRGYMSKKEYDEIVNSDRSDPDIFPHCDQTVFHEPGICAYCDGYYRRHPGFNPPAYVAAEANGWGGNQAPVIDDDKAAEEQAEWDEYMRDIISGEFEAKERKHLSEAVENILKVFRRPKV
jgi:hypothetical protein